MMEHYRCQCGEVEAWTTTMVAPCERCLSCGSGLTWRGEYVEPKPHAYVTRYNPHTGAPYEICATCLRCRSEIEAC